MPPCQKHVTKKPGKTVRKQLRNAHIPINIVLCRFVAPSRIRRESCYDMLPLSLNIEPIDVPKSDPRDAFGSEAWGFINLLRFVAIQCRVKPRTNLFEACALLKTNPSASSNAYAEALMRCLGDALGKTPRLYAPGSRDLTFDEQWLMRLCQAYARDDKDSQRFLLGSRIAFENRRLVGFLIREISDHFHKN